MLRSLGQFVKTCWSLARWVAGLALVAALVGVPYFYSQLDRELCRQIRQKLAQAYPRLTVKLHSAKLSDGEGIRLRGLTLAAPERSGPSAELLSVDELMLVGRIELADLIAGRVQPTTIIVRRPRLRATLQSDGTWSIAQLLPLPKLSHRPAPIVVEQAVLEIVDPFREPAATYTLQNVSLRLRPNLDSAGAAPDYVIEGSCEGPHLRQAEFSGRLNPETGQAAISGKLLELALCPELLGRLARPVAEPAQCLQPLRANVRGGWRVNYDPRRAKPLEFLVEGEFAQGRLDDPRLPLVLSDVRGRFRADERGFELQELTARSERASLWGSVRSTGYGARAPLAAELQIRQLRVDDSLIERLPPQLESLRGVWFKFLPAGEVDLRAKVAFDGQQWRPEVRIDLVDMAFTYHKFPYRLERTTGALTLEGRKLGLNLSGFAGEQPVKLEGEIFDPGPNFTGRVEIRGKDLVCDHKLLGALPDKTREVVSSLHPQGTFDCYVLLRRGVETGGELHKFAAVHINSGSIVYDKFAYPISNIQGDIELDGPNWSFGWALRPLTGSNGGGRIACYGWLKPGPTGNQLVLNFDGQEIPLDNDLRDALRPGQQQTWNALRPQGQVNLTADIRYETGTRALSVGVVARPLADTVSIEPAGFPYRVEKLAGEIHYRDGLAQWKRITGLHGATEIVCGGRAEAPAHGGWRLQLDPLEVRWNSADRELVQALPERLRRGIVRLNPAGSATVMGGLELIASPEPGVPLASSWDLSFQAVQLGLEAGGARLENIHGGLEHFTGRCDGQRFQAQGELQLDSVSLWEHQFTKVRGPLYLDDHELVLGSWRTEPVAGRPLRRVSAELYGGQVVGDAVVRLDPQPRFALRAALVDGELSRLALEKLPGAQSLAGKVHARVELQGAGGRQSLAGGGNIGLRDANIYELPAMMSLLKLLSIRTPDTNAFTESNIDFQVMGDRVFLSSLEFKGDAVSLHGRGEMNWNTELDLKCSALVGRGDLPLPWIKGMMRQASERILPIHIAGTLGAPQMKMEAFPAFNQALGQFQEDWRRTTGAGIRSADLRRAAGQSP
ncbi:MAG: hypothetical protein U0836_22145 [Pirellulales bacterium]